MFLAESPGLMSRIRDAIAEGDSASLVDPAHNLKNWASCFVANKTLTALALLEALGRADTLAGAGAAYTALERELERLEMALAQSIPEPLPPKGEGTLLAVGHEYRSPPCTL
jgi:HPt (histidine-containing phosphotransfer) domain-containing protein